ncbi:MAG: coproporphyrinogen dehydrogenase HemZ [Clostridia bacterium]|nr:coproporphyrinogen dehydrogenase HemZ [Clostridia bacterium]
MNVRIETKAPEFLNDFGDVVRLFYGDAPVRESGEADLVLVHTVENTDNVQTDIWSDGEHTASAETVIGNVHPLEVKRLRKRGGKRALYLLLKERTGLVLPWGGLTGIRPTRLYYEGLEEGLSEAESMSRLTDLFDVAPDRADLLREIADMQRGILHPEKDEFDLYIGIPFCTTRCSYCSFASGEIGNGKLVTPYVTALIREIELTGKMMSERGLRVRAAYIGGGTPTAIPCDDLRSIIDAAQTAFPNAKEWTVEAGRPDTITEEKLKMLLSRNITRISVNPQTFCDVTLKHIGRAHNGEDTVRAYELARSLGFDDINMDLIAALPGEDTEIFNRTLDKVIELSPDSVTVHTLAIKRSSRLHEQMHVLKTVPEQVTRVGADEMINTARRRLTEAGWHPYYLYRQKYMAGNLENVGYAKPGKACLYNIGNMEETASVLALGAGAITKWLFDREKHAAAKGVDVDALRFANLQLRIERAPNVRNIEQYIDRIDEMVARKRAVIFPED